MSREPEFRQNRIRFDWTVTAGNLLTVVGGIIAMAAAYADYRVTLDRHDMRIANNEVAVAALKQQLQESLKAQVETARALDRLTFQLQNEKK